MSNISSKLFPLTYLCSTSLVALSDSLCLALSLSLQFKHTHKHTHKLIQTHKHSPFLPLWYNSRYDCPFFCQSLFILLSIIRRWASLWGCPPSPGRLRWVLWRRAGSPRGGGCCATGAGWGGGVRSAGGLWGAVPWRTQTTWAVRVPGASPPGPYWTALAHLQQRQNMRKRHGLIHFKSYIS